MLFSFSSPSFSLIFPHLPLVSTYAMWLILEPPNLLYSLSTYVSVIDCVYFHFFCCINDHYIFFVFLTFFSPCMVFLIHTWCLSWSYSFYLWLISFLHRHHCPSLNPVELVFPPSLPSLLQSTCDTLRSHSDSLGFTPNMLPCHPTLGNFEEFACWQHKVGVGDGVAHLGTGQQTVK